MTDEWGSYENMDPTMGDPGLRQMKSGIKLDIGAGGPQFERRDMTWTTVDLYQPADVKADMGDLPYKDGQVDEMFSSHALEHVPRAKVQPILIEWFRALKSGGRVTILVPDFDYCARLWLEKGPQEAMGYVWGSQIHPGEFHQTGFTVGSLHGDLLAVGFDVVNIESKYIEEYHQDTIWAEAIKP